MHWNFLQKISGGDAKCIECDRTLESLTTERSADGKIRITLDVANAFKRVVQNTIRPGIIIMIRSLHLSKYAWLRSRCGSVLSCENVIRRRRYQVHSQTYHDLRIGRCRKCRSDGTYGCRICFPGSRTNRYAGSTDHSFSGSHVCSNCTKSNAACNAIF